MMGPRSGGTLNRMEAVIRNLYPVAATAALPREGAWPDTIKAILEIVMAAQIVSVIHRF